MPRLIGNTEHETQKFDDFVWKHRHKHPQMVADMYGKSRSAVYCSFKRLAKQGKIVELVKNREKK
jgi:hypothetical protein